MHKTVANQAVSNQTNPTAIDNNAAIAQLHKLQQVVCTRESAMTVAQSSRLLLSIAKESLILLWLTLCYVLVGFSWLGNQVMQTGQRSKTWWAGLQERYAKQSATEIAAETGKSIIDVSRAAISYTIRQAKKQVGLLDEQ